MSKANDITADFVVIGMGSVAGQLAKSALNVIGIERTRPGLIDLG